MSSLDIRLERIKKELYRAIKENDVQNVELCIKEGKEVKDEIIKDINLLYLAVESGNEKIIETLLNNGADINAKGKDGSTPLHWAAFNGLLNVVEFLVEKGSEIGAKDNFGSTPLYYAAKEGQLNVVKFLKYKGAKIDVKNKFNRTPLHWAAYNGHLDVVKFFIDEGAEIGAKDNLGSTSLHYAANEDKLDIVTLLVDKGAGIDEKNNNGLTSLELANELKIVKFLVNKLAILHNVTPLHAAIRYGRLNAVRLFINSKSEISTNDKEGNTPLHWAAKDGKLDVVELLINKGADVKARNNSGLTSLNLAEDGEKLDVMKLLVNKLATLDNITPLYAAIKYGTSKAVKLFIETDVNANHNKDETLLHYAAKVGNLDVMRLLLGKGIDVNVKQNDGTTPLHLASLYNIDSNVVKFLLDNGADVNAKSDYGTTPLHSVANRDSFEAVKLFLENGADSNAKDNHGYTSLHYAAHKGSVNVIKLLLEKGADVDGKTNKGEKALDIATRHNRKYVIEILKKKHEAHQLRKRSIQMVANNAAKSPLFVKNLFGWTKNLQNSIDFPALPSVHRGDSYTYFSQIDINGAISLFDLLSRQLTGEKYTLPMFYSSPKEFMEERIDLNAINVINNFEEILKSTDAANNINEFMSNFKVFCNSNGKVSLFKSKAYRTENSANSQIDSSVGTKNSLDYISLFKGIDNLQNR